MSTNKEVIKTSSLERLRFVFAARKQDLRACRRTGLWQPGPGFGLGRLTHRNSGSLVLQAGERG